MAACRQSHVRLLGTVERVHGQAGDEVHTGIGFFLLLHYSKAGMRTVGKRSGQEPVRRRLAVGTCGQELFHILRNILESAGRLQRQHIEPAAHHRLHQMGQARPVQLLSAEFPRSDTRYVDTLSVCIEQVGIQVHKKRRRRFRLLRRSSCTAQYTERFLCHIHVGA